MFANAWIYVLLYVFNIIIYLLYIYIYTNTYKTTCNKTMMINT